MTHPPEPGATGEASKDQAQLLAEQGRQYYRQGEYADALSHLQQAYELYGNDADRGLLAETANDIGVAYTSLRRWNEAEKWINEAHGLFLAVKDYDGEAQTLGNLGSMFHLRGDLKQAAASLQLAADRFHVLGDKERRMHSLRVLSIVRLRQFRLLQAVAAYEAALACHPKPTSLHRFLQRLLAIPLRVVRP
jgi:tetratricopeptide (TPR) repeat protein